jgi:hypothetical protein
MAPKTEKKQGASKLTCLAGLMIRQCLSDKAQQLSGFQI